MDDGMLSKEKLAKLRDEVKALEGSVLLEVTQKKIDLIKETTTDMAVYDTPTMVQREFFRGNKSGLEWITKDIHPFMDQIEQILQKEEK